MLFRKKATWHLVLNSEDQILGVYGEALLSEAQHLADNLQALGAIQLITVQRKGRPRVGDKL